MGCYHIRRIIMQFEVMRDALLEGFIWVGEAVARDTYSVLPILQGVRMEATSGRVELKVTDLNVGVRTLVDAAGVKPGKVVLLHSVPMEWLKVVTGEKVAVKLNERTKETTDTETGEVVKHRYPTSVRLECENNHITPRNVWLVEEFPTWPVMDEEPVVEMEGEVIKQAIDAVFWAAQPKHPVREGVLLSFNAGVVTFAGVSEWWMAEYRADAIPKKGYDPFQVILNPKAIAALSKLVKGAGIMVAIAVAENGNYVSFKWGDKEVVAWTIEGAFPKYERLITEAAEGEIVWKGDREEAIKLVSLAGLFAIDTKAIKLGWTGTEEMYAEAANYAGDFEGSSVDFEGETEITLAMSPKMLGAALASMEGAELRFHLRDPGMAVLLRPAESDRHSIVIMPMNITGGSDESHV
jgi:DNA polymerase III sliding clamp (beta) subunit (PCNA family)